MLRPRSAASRCSTVPIVTPGIVAQHGAQREILHKSNVGRDFSDDAAAFAHQETVADIGLRRVQNHGNVAPLWTPVPDNSISRPIVVCRDPINRFDTCDVPRSPIGSGCSVCSPISCAPVGPLKATDLRMLSPR